MSRFMKSDPSGKEQQHHEHDGVKECTKDSTSASVLVQLRILGNVISSAGNKPEYGFSSAVVDVKQ